MLFGVAGASGTGKSTLAQEAADELGIQFVPASVTQMAKEAGFDPVAPMSVEDRIIMQEHMVGTFVSRLRAIKDHAILDRTPLDMAAYMLAEVGMQSHQVLSPDLLKRVHRYVGVCQKAHALYFDRTFIAAPLDTYQEAPTRPVENPAYQAHVHILICGLVHSAPSNIPHYLMFTSDHDARMDCVVKNLRDRIEDVENMRKSSKKLH